MFQKIIDAVDNGFWLSDDDVYVVDSPFGFVRLIDVKLRWTSDGPEDPVCDAVFVVDPKGPYIQHAVVYGRDPDHEVALEWAADRNVFFYAQNVAELEQFRRRPHITGWRISYA